MRDPRTPVPCRSCSQPVVWALIVKTLKKCPFNAEHDPTHGTHVLHYRPGEKDPVAAVEVEPGSAPLARTSHFSTCPNAKDWSKRKRGGPPVRAGDLLPSGTKQGDQ